MVKLKLNRTTTVMLVGVISLLFLPWVLPTWIMFLCILIFMNILLAQSWNLLGTTGQITFGHAAFFGVGAYAALISTRLFTIHFPTSLLIGGIFAVAVAACIGPPFLRLRGPYFAIGSLGFAEFLRIVFRFIGIAGAEEVNILPAVPGFGFPHYYYISLVLVLAVVATSYIIKRSKIGIAFAAIRENEDAALCLGINTAIYKFLSFIMSSFFVGVGGSFYANFIGVFTASSVFEPGVSLKMVIMSIFGGLGTIEGPIIGAVSFTILEYFLRATFLYMHLIIFSFILIFSCILLPGGIWGAITGITPIRIPSLHAFKKYFARGRLRLVNKNDA